MSLEATNDTGTVTPTVPNTQSSLTETQGIEALRRMRTAPATTSPTTQTAPQGAEAAPTQDTAQTDDKVIPATEGEADPGAVELETVIVEPVSPETIVFYTDDGKPVTAEEAKNSHFRQQDYTAKSEHNASIRQVLEARSQITDQAAAFYAARMPFIMQVLDGLIPPEPDLALKSSDSSVYWDQVNTRREALARRATMEREWNAAKQAGDQLTQLQREERVIEENQKLLDAIPSWRDGRIAAKERTEIAEYARGIGYTDNEMAAADHRAVQVLRDAVLGRKVRLGGINSAKTATTKPSPTIQAGQTSGIDQRTVPTTPSRPTVDQDAPRRQRFTQGVGVLAARRRG